MSSAAVTTMNLPLNPGRVLMLGTFAAACWLLIPQEDYFALRPGVTGFWQVSTRNENHFSFRAEVDSPTYLAGLFSSHCALVHPARLVRMLRLYRARRATRHASHSLPERAAPLR